MPTLKFKVLRRVKGVAHGDAAKGKAPSIHQPGDIVTLDADDERIEHLLKTKVLEPTAPEAAAKKTVAKASATPANAAPASKSTAPESLEDFSVEDLRKLAVDAFAFDAASVAKLNKDELLALIAEAKAKEDKAVKA